MGELGMLGPTIPPEYGGPGLGYVAYGLIAREVERVDSGYRSMMSVQSSLVMLPIFRFGTEAQRRKYLPKLAKGEWIGCFGLTEPTRLRSRLDADAREEGEGRYSLTGTKTWISNSPIADVFVVWAKDDAGEIRGFVLEKNFKGLRHRKSTASGLAHLDHRRVVMDGVFCPEENAFPEVRGLKGRSPASTRRATASPGRARRRRGLLAPRAAIRPRPQAVRPAARREPADPEEARRHADRDHPRPTRLPAPRAHEGRGSASVEITSIMKRNSCGKALEIARLARDMLGGNGISDEFGVIRHVVNLEVVNTYEGTHDITR